MLSVGVILFENVRVPARVFAYERNPHLELGLLKAQHLEEGNYPTHIETTVADGALKLPIHVMTIIEPCVRHCKNEFQYCNPWNASHGPLPELLVQRRNADFEQHQLAHCVCSWSFLAKAALGCERASCPCDERIARLLMKMKAPLPLMCMMTNHTLADKRKKCPNALNLNCWMHLFDPKTRHQRNPCLKVAPMRELENAGRYGNDKVVAAAAAVVVG